MTAWWEKYPGRFEWEIDQLNDRGFSHQIAEKSSENGILELGVTCPKDLDEIQLKVVFPGLYPYFRPEVFAPDLDLGRHQNPFEKNLCLLGRSTFNWSPERSLADLISIQLPKILKINQQKDRKYITENEESQGEPFSHYYTFVPESYVLIDSSWDLDPKIFSGTFEFLGEIQRTTDFAPPLVRGRVAKVWGPRGELIAEFSGGVPIGHNTSLIGFWCRQETPPPLNDAGELYELAGGTVDAAVVKKQSFKKIGKRSFRIAAFVFPEETRLGESDDGWLFVARSQRRISRRRGRFQNHSLDVKIRTLRGGEGDLDERVPARRSLRSKKIAVFGTGALGGPLVVDLAKNGAGEIRIVDHDIVEPGPTVRWPIGEEGYGYKKVEALQSFISANYPNSKILEFPHRIGGLAPPDGKSDLDKAAEILDGVDIVIDATAEIGIHHFLSDWTRERGIPLIVLYATPGAAGGLVARFHHRKNSGCWQCMLLAQREGSIAVPPENVEDGLMQPVGCAERTFTGASFDLAEIVSEAMRYVAGTLSTDANDYPKTNWDVAILRHRDPDDIRIPPHWEPFELPIHKECQCCTGE